MFWLISISRIWNIGVLNVLATWFFLRVVGWKILQVRLWNNELISFFHYCVSGFFWSWSGSALKAWSARDTQFTSDYVRVIFLIRFLVHKNLTMIKRPASIVAQRFSYFFQFNWVTTTWVFRPANSKKIVIKSFWFAQCAKWILNEKKVYSLISVANASINHFKKSLKELVNPQKRKQTQ